MSVLFTSPKTKILFQGKKFSLLSYTKCCQKGSELSSPNTSYVNVVFYETHLLWILLNKKFNISESSHCI